MKPDWKNAPNWANWLAMDSTGEWWWFAKKPEMTKGKYWDEFEGMISRAIDPMASWKESLEARP